MDTPETLPDLGELIPFRASSGSLRSQVSRRRHGAGRYGLALAGERFGMAEANS
jgi:hypothetical protein